MRRRSITGVIHQPALKSVKTFPRTVLLVLTVFYVNASAAVAEFSCKATMHYTWKKGEAEQQVFWLGVESRAATEELAKAALAERLGHEEPKAMADCRRLHENLTQCVATKFASVVSVLSNMSFASRKTLEDSVKSDCTSAQGVCGVAKTGEVSCSEIKVVEPSPDAAAEGAAGEKKDDKKEKSKKK